MTSWETEVIIGQDAELPEGLVVVRCRTGERVRYVPERTASWEYPQNVNGWAGYVVCPSCGEKHDETVANSANYCPNCGAKVVD